MVRPKYEAVAIGHGIDMVLPPPPPGSFEDYDFLIAQCLTRFLNPVSALIGIT